MKLEATRIVADAMADPTHGINAQLVAVPRDPGDPQPPDIQDVVNDTEHDLRQRTRAASGYPLVSVFQPDPATVEGEVAQAVRDSDPFPVGIEYRALEAHSAEVARDASYTVRAILMTLDWLQRDSAARTRNQVEVQILDTIDVGPPDVIEERRAPQVAAVVSVAMQMRDKAPAGV